MGEAVALHFDDLRLRSARGEGKNEGLVPEKVLPSQFLCRSLVWHGVENFDLRLIAALFFLTGAKSFLIVSLTNELMTLEPLYADKIC